LFIDKLQQRCIDTIQKPDHLCEKGLVSLDSIETQQILKGSISSSKATTGCFLKRPSLLPCGVAFKK
jgi:hypothetical protein